MCLAIQEMRKESRIKGKIEGAITFTKKFGDDREAVKRSVIKKYRKSNDETEKLMKTY